MGFVPSMYRDPVNPLRCQRSGAERGVCLSHDHSPMGHLVMAMLTGNDRYSVKWLAYLGYVLRC